MVDEVIQWEIMGSVEGISERFLAPLLEQLITQFPFRIINFHRPSGYPTRVDDPKKPGKFKNVYKTYMTPFEKLQSLEQPEQYLKPGMTIALLTQFASQMSDTEAAEAMQKAKMELFKSFRVIHNQIASFTIPSVDII